MLKWRPFRSTLTFARKLVLALAAVRQVFLSRSRSNVLADIVPFLCRRVRAQVCKIVMIPCDSARKFVNTAWIDHT